MAKFIFSLLFICLITPSFAEEIPVNIKSEKLTYVEGTNIIKASGSVEVRLKGVTIYADLLTMDSESKVATAEGNVKMIAEDYEAFSSRLVYDASSEVSAYADFKTKLTSPKVKGYLFLSAQELNDVEEMMRGTKGSITTCGDEQPHFFTVADKVEFHPDDYVLGYNVFMIVGKAPVWWMPIMYYDLSDRGKQNWVFGHNDVEGDYIKSTWGYPLGILYLDLMQKKGFGHGTEIAYGLGAWGLGKFFIYHLDEQDTGITDWVTRIEHTKQIDPKTTLKIDHAYTATYLIPSGRRDQTTFGLNLAHSDKARWGLNFNTFDDRIAALQKYSFGFNQAQDKVSTNYNFNYDFAKKSPYWIRSSQRFSHRRPLSDKITLSTKANYYNYVADAGQNGDERLEPEVELSGRGDGYSWRIYENWYIDLDQNNYTGDESYQFLEKQPEVDISPNPINWPLFTLRPKFGYGYYREVRYVPALGRNRDFSTQRYQTTLNLDRTIPLAFGTTAILGAGVDQFLYGPGDQRYVYRERIRLQTRQFGFFENSINYRKGRSDGNTPFLFDQIGTNYHDVKETLTFYQGSKFRWQTDGGFNWQTHKWFDVNTNLSVKPQEQLSWNLRTGWEIENTRYKDLINNLTLIPYSFFTLTFQSVSDMNQGQLKSGSLLYDFYLLEGQRNQWHFKISQVYETASQQFKVRDIMLVKDLHCWELKYTYSDLRKEFGLTISLKALPDEPVGVSSGRGFYYEGFEKEFKKFKQEGEVRRY